MNPFRLIQSDPAPGYREVKIEGELDHAVRDQLRTALAGGADRRLLVDLSECEFVDGSGLEIIVWARQRLRRQGQELLLRGAHGQVRRLLSTAGVA
jgi:anti-sigma B factor antagonist